MILFTAYMMVGGTYTSYGDIAWDA